MRLLMWCPGIKWTIASKLVGRTPWSAADAPVGHSPDPSTKFDHQAGRGAGCGPGGPPYSFRAYIGLSSYFVDTALIALLFVTMGVAQNIEIGRKQFESHCASCHGVDGAGGEHAP